MALGLDRATRANAKGSALKKKTKSAVKAKATAKPAKARPTRRPWHLKETFKFEERKPRDSGLDFDFQAELLKLSPEDMDSATRIDLLKILAQQWVEEKWQRARQSSYWLSRLTHQNSWLARVQLFPRVRIPLPSFFTVKKTKDE